MTKKITLIITLCIAFLYTKAQHDFNLDWSKNIQYDPKTTGSLSEFAGANDKYVYAVFAPADRKLVKKQRQLIAYDKITMKQLGKVGIKASENEKFYDVQVTNDAVYVMFKETQKGKEIIKVQSFSQTLSNIASKRKIYQLTTSAKGLFGSGNTDKIKAISNSKANNNLYIIAEKPTKKGENIQLEYNVIDPTLNIINAGQIELPVAALSSGNFSLSSFRVGDDGNLISKNTIKAEKEIRKEDKIFNYALLTVVDIEKKTTQSLPVRSAGKHISGIDYYSRNGNLEVVGFYSESTGPRSERGKGVFKAILNLKTGELEETKFTEIDERKVDFSTIYLEKVTTDKDGNMMIVGTEDRNYSITTNTKNGTTTRYYNEKGEILVCNLSKSGELNWHQVISRRITYGTWYVRDLHAITTDENSFITYGDVFKKSAKNRTFIFFNGKSKKEMRDNITYAKLNNTTGSKSIQEFKLNKSNISRKDIKRVSPADIKEVDNSLYLNAFEIKPKTGVTLLGCASAPLCGIGCLYLFIKSKNGSAYKGGGSLGSFKAK